MSRRRRVNTHSDQESTFELDLSPMLALMVTLIPVMLLATVFVKVTIIETKVPQVVKDAIEEDRKKKKREIKIRVEMKNDKTLKVQLTEDGRNIRSKTLVPINGEWNLSDLHKELYSFKKMHPHLFRVNLFPDQNVKYDEIVKVMDEARKSKSDEEKFVFNDKKTNQPVETEIMFPDVIFSNVLGG